MDPNSYDVIVVGNDVLGLSLATALTLQSSGKVALVGDEARTFAATPTWPEFVAPMMAARYQRLAAEINDLYTPPAEFLSALNFSDEVDRAQLRSYYADVERAWRAAD